jgi:hypothetical protein
MAIIGAMIAVKKDWRKALNRPSPSSVARLITWRVWRCCFGAGADLLLRSERRAWLKVGHAGRGLCRRQHGRRLPALFLYLRFAPDYSATYGCIGAVVLMLWPYLMGVAILIGGEINAETARAVNMPTFQKEEFGGPRHKRSLFDRT